jgi:hypothetical protein
MVCRRLLMRVVFQNCQDVFRTLLCRFFQIIHRKARILEGKELDNVYFGDTSTLSNKRSITLLGTKHSKKCVSLEREAGRPN